MRTMTLTISGMSCGHCLNAVNKALASIPGVQVRGVQMGRAEVGYDSGVVDSAHIIAAIADAGYEVVGSREDAAVP
jgi:copper chaperone CopZ